MTGCAAYGCKNRHRKDMRMFRFPSDPARRRLWEMQVKRPNWTPGQGARLCQAHFEPDQFENNRQDGWKRLKLTAIPTLFAHLTPPKQRKPPKKRKATEAHNDEKSEPDHTYTKSPTLEPRPTYDPSLIKPESDCTSPAIDRENETRGDTNSSCPTATRNGCKDFPVDVKPESESCTPVVEREDQQDPLATSPPVGEHEDGVNSPMLDKVKQQDPDAEDAEFFSSDLPVCVQLSVPTTTYDYNEGQVVKLRAEVADLRRRLKLQEEKHATLYQNIGKLFNPDQILALASSTTRGHKWSIETIKKASRIRLACGGGGYDELLAQGYPLPSRRTLRRQAEGIAIDNECLKDIVSILKSEQEGSPQNDGMLNTGDPTIPVRENAMPDRDHQHQTLPPNEHLPQHTQHHQLPPHSQHHLLPRHDHQIPHSQQPIAHHPHTLPRHDHTMPLHDPSLPRNDHMIPRNDHTIPRSDHTIPQNNQTMPRNSLTLPRNDLVLSRNDLPMPRNDLTLPRTDHHPVAHSDHLLQRNDHVRPHLDHTLQHLGLAPPHPLHTLQRHDLTMPRPEHTLPRLEHTLQHHEHIRPPIPQTLPNRE